MIRAIALDYIIGFLLGKENEHLRARISYGTENFDTSVIIHPSSFFDADTYLTTQSMPAFPLDEMDGVPILFGKPEKRFENGKLHIYADIVASTFFLITRYEECVRRKVRDMHGRFIGKESLPYRGGFLTRPVVEEYGRLLRGWMRECGNPVQEPAMGFLKVYLTHDVDQIWTWDNLYRAIRTAAKRTVKNMPKKVESFRAWYDYKNNDPLYTFPWIVEQDTRLKKALGADKCKSAYFIMGCENGTYDIAYLSRRDRVAWLVDFLKKNGSIIGIHPSYKAGMTLRLIAQEKARIESIIEEPVFWSRNHFLRSREPEDFHTLIENGITDDFTMGYADVAGFRLGTCRAVKWIDPLNCDLTTLTMHPMTVMDCTLDSELYMSVQDCNEAFMYCKQLLDSICSSAGEVVLLWHNSSVACGAGYHRELYEKLVSYIITVSE